MSRDTNATTIRSISPEASARLARAYCAHYDAYDAKDRALKDLRIAREALKVAMAELRAAQRAHAAVINETDTDSE